MLKFIKIARWVILLLSIIVWSGCSTSIQQTQNSTINQYPESFSKVLTKKVGIDYLLYLPADYNLKDNFPLMVFLHGSGERGDDLQKVKMHGPPKLIEKGEKFPFIVISPQCPQGKRWTDPWIEETVVSLINDISKEYKVDTNRIYLTGLSMGGYGTWDIAENYTDKFAAIAPVCGIGDPDGAINLRLMPTWVFHGAKDDVVPIDEDKKMVEALEKYNKDVKFTIYPDANHDSWTETYNNKELYNWFLKQHKTQRNLIKVNKDDITSSSGDAYLAFDGNLQTRWESKMEDPQWIKIKLDNKKLVSKITIIWENAYSDKYIVSASNDGVNWDKIYTENNGDGILDNIEFPQIEYQYIKFDFSKRATQWGDSIWEIEIE